MKNFLGSESHAFTIAKIATVFQVCATAIISFSLMCSFYGTRNLNLLLTTTLLLDILFVIAHLTYRTLYYGPRIKLTSIERTIILVHAISSIAALTLTCTLLMVTITTMLYAYITLTLWTISLISGVLFFIKKYITKKNF